MVRRLRGFDAPTVWQEFTPLCAEHGAVNMGQGFPDWQPPAFLQTALREAAEAGHNQYTRSAGHPSLVRAVAARASAALAPREVDPLTEVTVSVGATEGLFAAMQALCEEGDEVVLLEPAFDIYRAQAQMAGATCVSVPLRAGGDGAWTLDVAELAAALSPRSRLLLLNTPHNPTGKVFSRAELEAIADVVRGHERLVVLTDEVYEHLTYDGAEHVRFAALEGMWERTLAVSSAGKTFSVTGWKVGWLVGPAALVGQVVLVNQWVQFSVPTVLQEAVARGLEAADAPYEGEANYYAWIRARYSALRDRLCAALREAGLQPSVPQGGIFVMADTSALEVPAAYLAETTAAAPVMRRDWALARWLTIEHRLTTIPPSVFYSDENKGEGANWLRFAFCKDDLEAGLERIRGLPSSS